MQTQIKQSNPEAPKASLSNEPNVVSPVVDPRGSTVSERIPPAVAPLEICCLICGFERGVACRLAYIEGDDHECVVLRKEVVKDYWEDFERSLLSSYL